jgi:hypothetical protein
MHVSRYRKGPGFRDVASSAHFHCNLKLNTGVLEFRCVIGREGCDSGDWDWLVADRGWKVVRATWNQTYTRAALQMGRCDEHESEGSLCWCFGFARAEVGKVGSLFVGRDSTRDKTLCTMIQTKALLKT